MSAWMVKLLIGIAYSALLLPKIIRACRQIRNHEKEIQGNLAKQAQESSEVRQWTAETEATGEHPFIASVGLQGLMEDFRKLTANRDGWKITLLTGIACLIILLVMLLLG